MAELFIAPPGAMQFLVTRWPNSGPLDVLLGKAIWLTGEMVTPNGHHCACARWYRVLREALPKDLQERLQSRFPGASPTVCSCNGFIIE